MLVVEIGLGGVYFCRFCFFLTSDFAVLLLDCLFVVFVINRVLEFFSSQLLLVAVDFVGQVVFLHGIDELRSDVFGL